MKGDFSRLRFNPKNNYTSVLQQQGRVSLDSDANEQSLIDDYLRSSELSDVVGPYGGPRDNCGFAISFAGGKLTIGKGRYYVNGLLCENDVDGLLYEEQPFLIDPTLSMDDLFRGLEAGKFPGVRVYLQVWQRLVTVLDDACLREPALGQADTTARLQTVWRVIAEPVEGFEFQAAELSDKLQPEIRKDIESGLKLADPTKLEKAIAADFDKGLTLQLPTLLPTTMSCCDAMYTAAKAAHMPGTLFAQTSDVDDDCSCEPTPPAGYRGLENQLYRVEIHTGGTAADATFKWSRENASVLVAVVSTSATVVTVASLGPDPNLGFKKGDWVEILDDADLFGSIPNQPGTLYQIDSIDRGALTVTMTASVDTAHTSKNARMRRWDQGGTSAAGLALTVGSSHTLENGIEVQFKDGHFISGDYWLIPARTATGSIEWPPCGSSGDYQPPLRSNIMLAPLACIAPPVQQVDVTGLRSSVGAGAEIGKTAIYPVTDCRRCFYPLTKLTPPETPKAIHVIKKSWSHDDIMTVDELIGNGLTLIVDKALASPITGGNFIMTFEWAAPPVVAPEKSILAGAAMPAWTTLRTSIIVETAGALSQKNINSPTGEATELHWKLPYLPTDLGQDEVIMYLALLISYGAPLGRFCRVRVRMMGSSIFSGSSSADRLYLDGRCFSEAAINVLKKPRLELILPSGDGERASDFESWFYLAPVLFILSIEPNFNAVTVIVDNNNKVVGLVNNILTNIKATIKLTSAAVKKTTIQLAISPNGFENAAQVPHSVEVPAGSASVDFPITVAFNPGQDDSGGIRKQFVIAATLQPAGGIPPNSASCNFMVIGALRQFPQQFPILNEKIG